MNHKSLQSQLSGSEMNGSRSRSLRDLCQVVARRARTRGIFFTDRDDRSQQVMQSCYPDMKVQDVSLIARQKPKGFRNVILFHVLENIEAEEGSAILRKCWDLLEEKGRLIVVVPNEDMYRSRYQVRKFKRQSLRKTLEPLGKPRLITEQPLKWLVMYLDKRNGKKSGAHITKQKRIETTARLCRGSVLELGCGRGELTNEIGRRGMEVVGVDKNAEKIKQAQQLYPDLAFHQKDVLKMSTSEPASDTVVLAEILEHVSDAMGNQMLEVAWRLLKPGGRLIVSVPNEHSIPNPNHIRQFSRHSLTAMLQRFGKPKIETDQPYKWLIMHVDKHS